jgi:hypothetical protein
LGIAGSSLGYKLNETTKLKMSESKKGTPSHRKGVVLSEYTRLLIKENNKKSKPIFMYSKDKVLLDQFNSIADAAVSTGIHRTRISRACISQR